jgi:hypothetical protein
MKWISSSDNSQSTVPAYLEEFFEMCISHLGDAHQKIVHEAMDTIHDCCKNKNQLVINSLGTLLPSLFFRLADRKPGPRAQANEILDTLRVVYDPVILLSSLSPKVTEMPERMRVAVFQFLITIIPQCEQYFTNSHNTTTFLSRIAGLLGSTGPSKPSSSLLIAGRRLLELSYKVSSKVYFSPWH